MQTSTHTPAVDPDFALAIVDDLYRYRPCRLWVMTLLALPLGIFGAHRFYCGRSFTGLLMLFTVGGGLIWWLWDLLHLAQMVRETEASDQRRLNAGLPPRGLGFLPPREELRLDVPPAWAARRAGRGRVLASAVLLALNGLALGAVSNATGDYEPMLVLMLFIAASLLAARWKSMARIPGLNALSRWVHRLRLYYHSVDPGHVLRLALRPLVGIFFAPWRPKARAEVRLYMQFGVLIAGLFAAMDAIELAASGGFWTGLGMLVAEFIQTFVMIYLFVAPAGALLTTQLLLARRDRVVWVLSAVTLMAMYLGTAL